MVDSSLSPHNALYNSQIILIYNVNAKSKRDIWDRDIWPIFVHFSPIFWGRIMQFLEAYRIIALLLKEI